MTDTTPPPAPEPTPTPEPTAYVAPASPTAPYATPGAPAKAPVLSIISLIAGILGVLAGFVGWGLLFSIGAIVLGHLGQKRETAAKGFWLTGLITGYVGLAINLILIAIGIFALIVLGGAATQYSTY